MTNPLTMTSWVKNTQRFQEYALVNKAVLESTGVDVPMIGLARNDKERKELLFRQTLILLAAFIIAPLHAKLFVKHFSRRYGFDSRLMKLSFKALEDNTKLKNGLEKLAPSLKEKVKKYGSLRLPGYPLDQLRQNLIKAKTNLLIFDVMLEGLIFANLGWIKNWFGKMLTGKDQFTGEMDIVSQQKLDQLYATRKNQKGYEKLMPFLTSGLAILGPTILGLMLRKATLRPAGTSRIMNLLKDKAHLFDYNKGYLLSFTPFLMVGILNDIGDILAARSQNERREAILKKIPVTLTFYFGDLFWMKLLSRLCLKRLQIPATTSIRKAISAAPPELQAKTAKSAAGLYWLSFLLNILTVGGVIAFNNRWTTEKLKKDANALAPEHIENPFQNSAITSNLLHRNSKIYSPFDGRLGEIMKANYLTPAQLPYENAFSRALPNRL